MLALLLLLVSFSGLAEDSTNQFLLLRLRLKAGEVTLVQATVVTGTLKPQRDTSELEPLVASLESASSEALWILDIADPSVERYEYEDPDNPGQLRSKSVQLDDVEFVVRAPFVANVREIAIYRKQQTAEQAKARLPAIEKKLLSRIVLPSEVTK